MRDPRRWLLILVAISAALAFFFARSGPKERVARSQCLTDAECLKTERCVVVPKPDGFATIGQCGEQCTADEQCANGWRCLELADEEKFVAPPKQAGAKRVRVCMHPQQK